VSKIILSSPGSGHGYRDRTGHGPRRAAANGVEAIAEFRRHRPDITLMDLRLPGANGTDILIAIRGEFPGARFIMLSSSDSDGEISVHFVRERRLRSEKHATG